MELKNDEYKELVTILGFVPPTLNLIAVAMGKMEIDITKLDEMLSAKDPAYDWENGSYNGKPCSMMQYVERKFGKKAAQLIDQLS